MFLEKIYRGILVWATLALGVFALVGAWDVVVYVILYVFVFGALLYRYRGPIGSVLRKLGFGLYPLFFLLIIGLVLSEEYLVYFLSGPEGIMHPNLFVNMTLISVFWLTWLSSWYFYISKKYAFTRKEAILTAGFAGFLYEIVGPLQFMDLAVVGLMTPLAILIYATVSILPMQVMNFSGKVRTKAKYWVATFLPFVVTWPVAFVFYILFTALGYELG